MPTDHSTSSAMFNPSLATRTSGPPQRASIPVLALEAQPPTGLLLRPTCRGAGPLQVLKHGDSRATPGRPARSDQSTMPTGQWPLEGYRDVIPPDHLIGDFRSCQFSFEESARAPGPLS